MWRRLGGDEHWENRTGRFHNKDDRKGATEDSAEITSLSVYAFLKAPLFLFAIRTAIVF